MTNGEMGTCWSYVKSSFTKRISLVPIDPLTQMKFHSIILAFDNCKMKCSVSFIVCAVQIHAFAQQKLNCLIFGHCKLLQEVHRALISQPLDNNNWIIFKLLSPFSTAIKSAFLWLASSSFIKLTLTFCRSIISSISLFCKSPFSAPQIFHNRAYFNQ